MNNLISVLKNYLSESEVAALPATTDAYVDAIKKRYSTPNGRRLTNYAPDEIYEHGKLHFSFAYKRDSLKIELATGEDNLFLTNSGQASLFVGLIYAGFFENHRTIGRMSHVYIGAQEAAKTLGIEFVHPRESRAFWICSSDFKQEQLEEIQSLVDGIDLVLIDTTCWDLYSRVTEKLLQLFSEKTVIIMRSVSKLDMGGVEYGSLGSLVLHSKSEVEEKRELLERILKIAGGFPSLDDVPPYLFDGDYLRNISMRNKLLEETTKEIQKLSSEFVFPENVSSYFPQHQKYFFLSIRTDDFGDGKQYLRILHRVFRTYGVPAKVIASFGFDDTAITSYREPESSIGILRISPGHGEKRAILIAKSLSYFLTLVSHLNRKGLTHD